MNVKSVCLCTLVGTLLGVGAARAQDPRVPAAGRGSELTTPSVPTSAWPSDADSPSMAPSAPRQTMPYGPESPLASPDGNGPPPGPVPLQAKLSSWLTYNRPGGCCSPIGGNGPIQSEVFLRSGISVPIGGA